MGGAEDRTYYGATPRCPPNTGGVGGPPPTREFHYSVPDHFRTGSASSRQSRNRSSASSNYHSPHVASSSSSSRRSGSGRSAAGAGGAGAPEQYYLDKSSPYHHGRRQQDYFMRQQVNTNRVDGTGGAEGAQAPPSFLDLCSKNFKISQIWAENFFFYLVVPPHKKFASVHPEQEYE